MRLDSARQELTRASAARDSLALRRLLSDSIMLVSAGDTLRGDSSVVAYLARDEDAALTLRPEIRDDCDDLEREVGVATTPDQHMYAYRGEWRLTDDGARLRALELLPPEPRLERLRRRCSDRRLEEAFDARRWTAAFTTTPVDGWYDGTKRSLRQKLQQNGWSDTYDGDCHPGCLDKADAGFYPNSNSGVAAWSLRAGYRWRPLVIEGVLTKLPTIHAAGYREDVDRVIRTTARSVSVAVVGTVERDRFRVGLGPVYRRDGWQWGDTQHTSPFTQTVTPDDGHWTVNLFGILADASYAMPLTSRAFVELRWEGALLPDQTLRAIRELPPVRLRNSYQVLGFGLGLRP